MLQVRRILQLLSDGYSKREASRQTGTSRNTIDSYELRFHGSGKSYNELHLLINEPNISKVSLNSQMLLFYRLYFP